MGHVDVVKCLLKHNANAKDHFEQSLLHLAIGRGYLDVVKCLFEHNIDVMAHDGETRSPLHYAAAQGFVDVVTCLLDHGADVNAMTTNGESPLHCAIDMGHLDVVKCLLEHHVDIEAKDKDGWSAIHFAARQGSVDVVTCLLDHGADVNAMTTNGKSMLRCAIDMGHLNVVKCLLEHHIDVEAKDEDEWSAIHFAARQGSVDIVTYLLDHGANINAMTTKGRNPLHLAAWQKYVDVVKCLLEHHVDVEAKDKDGWSAIHFIAEQGSIDVVTCLLDHEVDVNAFTKDGKSPLCLAVTNKHLDVMAFLIKKGADFRILHTDRKSPLLLAFQNQRFDLFSKRLETIDDINFKGEDGNNVLHLAILAYAGKKEEMIGIVKLLRNCNVSINAKNAAGYSPMFAAVAKGHTLVVKELLESKAKIKLMEECNGYTLIQIAYHYGHEKIKEALLDCDDVSQYVELLYRDRQVYVDAANAILVGRALIASVTFASWLQPPLGYTTSYFANLSTSDLNYVDVQHNVLLQAFWVFNTLSFYFAIGTVVFGARSVLPRRSLFIKDIVTRLHFSLLVTSVLLACSVLFVIIAFGIAGCIVLTPILKFQWCMIVPTILGGLVCVISLGCLFKSMFEDNLKKKRNLDLCLFD